MKGQFSLLRVTNPAFNITLSPAQKRGFLRPLKTSSPNSKELGSGPSLWMRKSKKQIWNLKLEEDSLSVCSILSSVAPPEPHFLHISEIFPCSPSAWSQEIPGLGEGGCSTWQISVLFRGHKHKWVMYMKEKTIKALNTSSNCLDKNNFQGRRKIGCKNKANCSIFLFLSAWSWHQSWSLTHSPPLHPQAEHEAPTTYVYILWLGGDVKQKQKNHFGWLWKDLEVTAIQWLKPNKPCHPPCPCQPFCYYALFSQIYLWNTLQQA